MRGTILLMLNDEKRQNRFSEKWAWALHLVLGLLPISAVLMYVCPDCYESIHDWIYSDPRQISRRARIVVWGSTLLIPVIVFSIYALRIWFRLRQVRERGTSGLHRVYRSEKALLLEHPGRRLLHGFVASLTLVTLFSTLLTGWPLLHWYHDWQVLRFAEGLRSIPLPDDSRIIAIGSRFGLLRGNSRHCDAQVMALVETTLDDRRISLFFRKAMPLKLPFTDGPGYIDIMKIDNQGLYHVLGGIAFPIWRDSALSGYSLILLDRSLEQGDIEAVRRLADSHPLSSAKHYYILIASDQVFAGYHLLDQRCH